MPIYTNVFFICNWNTIEEDQEHPQEKPQWQPWFKTVIPKVGGRFPLGRPEAILGFVRSTQNKLHSFFFFVNCGTVAINNWTSVCFLFATRIVVFGGITDFKYICYRFKASVSVISVQVMHTTLV